MSRRRVPGSADPQVFWGDPTEPGDAAPPIRRVEDPTALLRSLGSPRLAGNRHAEHYLAAVYEKAAGLASAASSCARRSEGSGGNDGSWSIGMSTVQFIGPW